MAHDAGHTSNALAVFTGDEAPERVHAGELVAPSKPCWREWAGREHGGESYRFGDISRHVFKRRVRSEKSGSAAGAVREEDGDAEDASKWVGEEHLKTDAESVASDMTGTDVLDLEDKSDEDSKSTSSGEHVSDYDVWFGRCGLDVELTGPRVLEDHEQPILAQRRPGTVLNGISLSAEPLRPVMVLDTADVAQYSFEFQVLAVQRGTCKTLSLGFFWGAEDVAHLPETAAALRRAFVVGGDLPRWYLDGQEVGKVQTWRPRTDVVRGTVIKALLQVGQTHLTMTIFQDSAKRAEVTTVFNPLVTPWALERPPLAVIDVCGSVQKVRLLQSSRSALRRQTQWDDAPTLEESRLSRASTEHI